MTDRLKRPSAKKAHSTVAELKRLRIELRLLRTSHNPTDDMLLLDCLICGAPLGLKESGLRHCRPCDEIESLTRQLKTPRPNLLPKTIHDCSLFVKYATNCPACTEMLKGTTPELLSGVMKEILLLKRNYKNELRELRDELKQTKIVSARLVLTAREAYKFIERKTNFFRHALVSISKLTDSADNCSVARHRAHKAVTTPHEDMMFPHQTMPLNQDPNIYNDITSVDASK